MKRLTRFGLAGLVLVAAAAGFAWHNLSRGGESGGLVTAATRAAAQSDAAELRLEGADGAPASLAAVAELWTTDELESARSALEAVIRERPEEAAAHLLLSEVARRLGDADLALAEAERARALAPHRSEAQHRFAKALVRKMQGGGMFFAMKSLGAYKDAMQAAIELDPENIEARREQAAFYVLVPKIAGGDRERGLALADELAAIDPPGAAWLRAMAAVADEDMAAGIEHCRTALADHPDDPDLRASLAMMLQGEERFDEAQDEYRTVLDREPDVHYYRALYGLGRCLIEAEGDLEEAVLVFDRYIAGAPVGIDMMPPVAGAHWRRGTALAALGRADEARAAYERALELEPDLDEARASLDALDG